MDAQALNIERCLYGIDVSSMVYRISLESKVHYFHLLFWSRNLKRELVMQIYIRRSQSTAAISKMAKGSEGKGREGVIKVVDSSFRFTRVVRFGATGQFFVPREPMVSRSTISTRPVIPDIRTHVYIPLPQIDKTLMEAIYQALLDCFVCHSLSRACHYRTHVCFLFLFDISNRVLKM